MPLHEWPPDCLPDDDYRFVVKLRDEIEIRAGGGAVDIDQVVRLLRIQGVPIRLSALYQSVPDDDLQALLDDARAGEATYRPPQFRNYFALTTSRESAPAVASTLLARTLADGHNKPIVQYFYPENSTPRTEIWPVDLCTAPDFEQAYLGPTGVNASALEGVAGADGRGVRFIDVEGGWYLDHQDLTLPVAYASGVNSPELEDQQHGTAVLGVVTGRGNENGCKGIAPGLAWVGLASIWRLDRDRKCPMYDPAGAIMHAFLQRSPGTVILLEAHADRRWPIESKPAVFDAISVATRAGVVVVEAAGNGFANIDVDMFAPGPHINPAIHDSGAIIVGAGAWDSTEKKWTKLASSNYGARRVNCFGWGDRVQSAGWYNGPQPDNPKTAYTSCFQQTSAAAAMVAGAAIAVQGMWLARKGRPAQPRKVRELLSRAATGVRADYIGVMPDLARIERQITN